MEFSKLERAAIEVILSRPPEGMDVLRLQFASASVLRRDYTGVGFFTTIFVPSSVPSRQISGEVHDALFDGALGQPKSDPAGWVHFMLWTDDDGRLASLEGYTVRDSWPKDDDIEVVGACETR